MTFAICLRNAMFGFAILNACCGNFIVSAICNGVALLVDSTIEDETELD